MEPHTVLATLIAGGRLNALDAEALFERMLTGGLDDAQTAGTLALLQSRPPSVPEIVGAARAMRQHLLPVRAPEGRTLVDTCGTGGAPKLFNISTAAAIVAAGIESPRGVRIAVAKHGNRSRTGRGSAEVLAALGVNVDCDPDVQARCLEQAGMCFCFAIRHHPSMKHAIGPRRSLGFPTIFNLLGPLTNPAGARRQVIGVYREDLLAPMARALLELGAERAAVVHASAGAVPLDELTTAAPSTLIDVGPHGLRTHRVDPQALGLAPASLAELCVDSVEESADLVRGILNGRPGPARDTVLLSAAAAALVADAAADLREGLGLAATSIDSGSAQRVLESLVRVSNAV